MKKGLLVAFAALILILPVSGGHAAMIELIGLPQFIQPGESGSFDFEVYLNEPGSMPNIDAFNVGLQISGADDLLMPMASVVGPDEPDYIFAGNTFAFSSGNPDGNLNNVTFGDSTDNLTGVVLGSEPLLLGGLTLTYPELSAGAALTFSLIEAESFVDSDRSTGYQTENLEMMTTTIPTPIPATIWIMGGGLLALLRFRRSDRR